MISTSKAEVLWFSFEQPSIKVRKGRKVSKVTGEPFYHSPQLSANASLHPHVRSKFARGWREAGKEAILGLPKTKQQRIAKVSKSDAIWLVQLWLPVARDNRRDPANYHATAKPVIDGFTDAGCWPDDTPGYVSVLSPGFRMVKDLDDTTVWVRMVPYESPFWHVDLSQSKMPRRQLLGE